MNRDQQVQPQHALAPRTARDRHLDVCRGLAIILVVVIHFVDGAAGRFASFATMPFFFLLSGFFHRRTTPLGVMAVQKTLSLLVPYFLYLFLFSLGKLEDRLADALTDGHWGDLFSFVGSLLYGGEILGAQFGVFWFITCLFLTQLVYQVLVVTFRGHGPVIGLILGFYLAAHANQYLAPSFHLPWNANVIATAIGFYMLGDLYGARILKNQSRLILIAAGSVALLAWLLVTIDPGVSFNMKDAEYGWPVLSPFMSICVIISLSWVARQIDRWTPAARLCAFVGAGSLTIMYVHQYVHFRFFEDAVREWPWLMTLVVVALCLACHWLLSRWRWTRVLLLGSRRDWPKLSTKTRRPADQSISPASSPSTTNRQ